MPITSSNMQRATRLLRTTAGAPQPLLSSPIDATSRRHCSSLRWYNSSTCVFIHSRPQSTSYAKLFSCKYQSTRLCSSTKSKMSFSNTDTGNKPADPYKAHNKEEPGTAEKIEDLGSFIKSCKFGMMTTKAAEQGLLVSRCMALAAQEAGGIDLIFHTNTESGKTDDLEKDPNINMAFLDSTGSWASVSGKASIITDRGMVKKYYSPALKAWLGDLEDGTHDGSENDPRIGVIKVEAKTATYAVSRSNAIARGIEMVSSAITGNAAQVNKLRELSEAEISQWRSSH